MIYIATFSFSQQLGGQIAEGNFQVVGSLPKSSATASTAAVPSLPPRAAVLTEHAVEKVKRMVESKNVDFAGDVAFYLDSLVELVSPLPPVPSVVLNLFEATPDGETVLSEVPLDEDVDNVVVHRSSKIWNKAIGALPVFSSKDGVVK